MLFLIFLLGFDLFRPVVLLEDLGANGLPKRSSFPSVWFFGFGEIELLDLWFFTKLNFGLWSTLATVNITSEFEVRSHFLSVSFQNPECTDNILRHNHMILRLMALEMLICCKICNRSLAEWSMHVIVLFEGHCLTQCTVFEEVSFYIAWQLVSIEASSFGICSFSPWLLLKL